MGEGTAFIVSCVLEIKNIKFQIEKKDERKEHFKSFVKKISSRWTSKAIFLKKFEQLPVGWENGKEFA